jgi:hypothetical protein
LKHHCEVGAHNYTAHSNVAGQPDPPLLLGCMQLQCRVHAPGPGSTLQQGRVREHAPCTAAACSMLQQLPTTSETVLVVNHPHSLKPEWMATTPPVRFS